MSAVFCRTRLSAALCRIVIGAAICSSGCGDDASKEAPKPPPRPPAAAAPVGTPVAALQPSVDQSKEALLAEVRKRQLTNDDFKESDDNRDPFRSFLANFGGGPPPLGKQHKIILEKFSIDELELVAIAGGDEITPRAMFLDPGGKGVTVKRGDHVSKADALVVRVAPDRVFFQIEEDAGGGKTRTVERVIELHAGELTPQE